MNIPSWQLQTPINAIVFDCDGTLSAIEGINELARNNDVYKEVERLTTEAMNKTGLNPALYQQRLELIYPTKQQVEALAQTYVTHCVQDANTIIQLLQRLHKTVYIISAGVNPAIYLFGDILRVPHQQIYAVDLQFDDIGHYVDFDRHSPLVHNHGKRELVHLLKKIHPHIIHVGDALNDYVTHDIVTRFIGYGGVYYRQHLEEKCNFYVKDLSLASILPLCLTSEEVNTLHVDETDLYIKGLDAIKTKQVKTPSN